MSRATPAAVLMSALASLAPTPEAVSAGPTPEPLRFEVEPAEGLADGPLDGRLFVVLGRRSRPDPRLTIGRTGLDAPPVLAGDVSGLAPGRPGVLDGPAETFPIERLADLPAGTYHAQTLLDRDNDHRSLDAPGNLFSDVQEVRIDPALGGTVRLRLSGIIPPDPLPPDEPQVRFVEIRSERLSAFHGRPFSIRAGVILPRGFDREPDRRYPLRVHIGGYGARYTSVQRMMAPGSPFRNAWNADDAPRFVLLHLDGDGPLGDPYQVNSANHGPYGDAITEELIPLVERRFRCIGRPHARVLDGASTGGWVALALQVFYPETFNGAWGFCPDPVDFRSFQLVNIYEDTNAYVNPHGFERPSARDLDGDVRFTMRHECRLENVLGRGDSYTMSGGQSGAWNATFGPRGPDGRPEPLWDPRTGRIDREVAEHWKRYDLRLVLRENWASLGPKLRGKLHIYVGEADDYFLNNAVHRLDEFLSDADPPFEGTIAYGPRQGHCWAALGDRELLDQMADAVAEGGAGDRRDRD